MTLQTFTPGFFIPTPGNGMTSTPSLAATILDAADEGVAAIFAAPKTGNISKVAFLTGTVTTGSILDVRLETVSTTDGNPTGTLFGTNTNGSQTIIATTDNNKWFEVTLTASASVTLGDKLAALVKQPTVSAGNTVVQRVSSVINSNFPYSDVNTGVSPAVSWAKSSSSQLITALGYDDGSWVIPTFAASTITQTSFSTSSTPDARGLRFQFPFDLRAVGFWSVFDGAGDWAIRLVSTAYNQGAGTGILASFTNDKDIDNVSVGMYQGFFTPTTLTANTNYRLIWEPTTTTNINVYDYTLPSSAIMDATPGGNNFHLTTAKDPTGDGDWTNYNNGTDGYRKPFMGLIVDGIDIPSGGGSGGAYTWIG